MFLDRTSLGTRAQWCV